MTDSAFSGLPAAGAITGTELLCLSQAGQSVETSIDNFLSQTSGIKFITSEAKWIANTLDLGGGRRELLNNTCYRVAGNVARSFTLVTNGHTLIFGASARNDVDEYTGTGDSLEVPAGVTESLILRDHTSKASNIAANWVNCANGCFGLTILDVIVAATNLGTLGGLGIFASQSVFGGGGITFDTGFTVTTTGGRNFFIRDCGVGPTPGMAVTVFTLGVSDYGTFRIHDNSCNFDVDHKILDGLASGANVAKSGFVTGNDFDFATNPLVGIDPKVEPWNFQNNGGSVKNSEVIGGYSTNVSAPTTLSGGAWAKVAGTTTASPLNERMTMSSDNELTVEAPTSIAPVLTANCSVVKGSASAASFDLAFAVDTGSGFNVIPETISPVSVTNVITHISVVGLEGLAFGDKVQVWMRNNTNDDSATATINVTVK
jgi:hypothetical protein